MVGNAFGGREVGGVAVQEDGAQAGVVGSADVGLEIVANHQRVFGACACLLEGIAEEVGVGLIDSGLLREDDGVEVVVEVRGVELGGLHFAEAVAAHVHPITAGA